MVVMAILIFNNLKARGYFSIRKKIEVILKFFREN